MSNATLLLTAVERGDPKAADQLLELVYGELRALATHKMAQESPGHTLQPTALVHEAFLKLSGGRHPSYENRSHFYGIASRLMRQILVDTARAKASAKRSAAQIVALTDVPDAGGQPDRSVLALEDALQWLEKVDDLKGRLIEMRYFAGMTAEECSSALSIPVHTVRRELRLAQVWLRKQMADETSRTGAIDVDQTFRVPIQIAS